MSKTAMNERRRGEARGEGAPPPSGGSLGGGSAGFQPAWLLGGAVVLGGLGAVLAGDLVVKIAGVVLAVCTLQGIARGATKIAGAVVGLLAGLAVCAPAGRAIEPIVASVLGTGGVLNRALSMGLCALAVTLGVWLVVARLSKGARERWAGVKRWDGLLGGLLGLGEGVMLVMLAMWIPMTLEPIAAPRAAESPAARAVTAWAKRVNESALGSFARSTNALADSRLLRLIQDFAAVSRHEPAMRQFLASGVMTKIEELPSVKSALEQMKSDAGLRAILERPGGLRAGDVQAILSSETVLRVLDTTTIVQDLTPIVGEVELALAEAKKLVPEGG